MAYPAPFLRLVASGTLFGVESWSWSLSLVPNFPGDGDVPDSVPNGVVTAVSAFHASVHVASSAARLNTLKLNLIGEDGRYVNQGETVLHDYGTPGVPGFTVPAYPAQVSLAVTLRTARSRGRAHAGRFYLPNPTTPLVAADGRISVQTATDIANAAETMLQAINTAVDGYYVGVASDVGAGAFEEVTGVAVGRTLDTIRSRRTSIPEAYVEVPLAP